MQSEIYVLAGERSLATVHRFLETLGDRFGPAAAEYAFPRFAEQPTAVYSTVEEIVRRLLAERDQPYEIYWTNKEPGALVASAMLFFTNDGELIAGLALRTEEEPVVRTQLDRLARTVGGKWGTVSSESPPPDSADEFRQLVRETVSPRLMPESER